jgi:hypothetical protein
MEKPIFNINWNDKFKATVGIPTYRENDLDRLATTLRLLKITFETRKDGLFTEFEITCTMKTAGFIYSLVAEHILTE